MVLISSVHFAPFDRVKLQTLNTAHDKKRTHTANCSTLSTFPPFFHRQTTTSCSPRSRLLAKMHTLVNLDGRRRINLLTLLGETYFFNVICGSAATFLSLPVS
jgi:hypothetical protein